MRSHLAILGVALVLVACANNGAGSGDVTAKQTKQAVIDLADESIPIAADVLTATRVEAESEWFGCTQNLSWKYRGGGVIAAPEGTVADQLEEIRAALVEAGYTDITQVEGHVSVEQDDFTLDIRQPAVRDLKLWTLTFASACHSYDDADQELIDADSTHVHELTP